MIDAKAAVTSARKYFSELSSRHALDMSVEEVELDSENEVWQVTLGYITNAYSGNKEYKIFEIDAETGEVLSMKIRELDY